MTWTFRAVEEKGGSRERATALEPRLHQCLREWPIIQLCALPHDLGPATPPTTSWCTASMATIQR